MQVGFFGLLSLILVAAKVFGALQISWLVALLPVVLGFILMTTFVLFVAIMTALK